MADVNDVLARMSAKLGDVIAQNAVLESEKKELQDRISTLEGMVEKEETSDE